MDEKIPAFSEPDITLMKRVFQVRKHLNQLRTISPVILETLTVVEVYDLLIEFIEIVEFIRQNVTEMTLEKATSMIELENQMDFVSESHYTDFTPFKRQMFSVNRNVGGLRFFKTHPLPVPFSEEEKEILQTMRITAIVCKSRLKKGVPLPLLSRLEQSDKRAKQKLAKSNDYFARKRHRMG